jgi:hypothetical protein
MLSDGSPPFPQPLNAESGPALPDPQELQAFVGRFQRVEPSKVVRARIDAGIDQAIATLSWPLRTVYRPLLRFIAQLPDWITIEDKDGLLGVTFSSGIALWAPLGGEARLHPLPAGFKAEVRHLWREGRICTEAVSDDGTITNVFELSSAGEITGHATLESQHMPAPLRYSMRLSRNATSP